MKKHYSETQGAMIYGSYLALQDYGAVSALYRNLGWSLCTQTVYRIVEKFKTTGSFRHYAGGGRPEIATDYAEELIADSLINQDMMSKETRSRLKKEMGLDLSERTISRKAKSEGLVYATILPRKELNQVQIQKRITFAQEVCQLDPSLLIFADESPFYYDWKCIQKRWMFQHKPIMKKEIHSNICLQVYAAISLKDKTSLYFLPIDMTWNSTSYKEALQSTLLPFLDTHYRTKHCLYIQDQASCHHSKDTSDFLQSNHIPFKYQPPNSPDLNPIEHIWGLLKTNVYKNGGFRSRKELINRIAREWEDLPQGLIQKTIEKVLKKNILPLALSG